MIKQHYNGVPMQLINSLRQILGDTATDVLIRSGRQMADGTVEAFDHLKNTYKNTLTDAPDDLFRQSDELVNDSNLAMRDFEESRGLYDQHIYDMGLQDYQSEAIGRAFHKTGIDDRLLQSGGRSPEPLIDELRLRNDDVFQYMDNNFGIKLDDEVANITRTMLDDADTIGGTSKFRNPHILQKEIEDFITSTGRGADEESLSMLGRVSSKEFQQDYNDLLRLKAWSQFDSRDKATILSALKGDKAEGVKNIFKYRQDLDRMTRELLTPEELRNTMPNYTHRAYKESTKPIIVEPSMAREMIALGAAKHLSDIQVGGVAKVRVLPIRNFEPERAQGALKVDGKYERGSSFDFTPDNIPYNQQTAKELAEQGYTIRSLINKDGEAVEHSVLTEGKDGFKIGGVHKPLSDAEQLLKGRIDSAHEVIANTFGKLSKDKNLQAIKTKVETQLTNNVTQGGNDLAQGSMPLFLKTEQKVFNPISNTYETVHTAEGAQWLTRNKAMLDNEYISLAELGIKTPYQVNYVKKEYFRELFGYQHWMVTEGTNWKAQMLETFAKEGIDFVRSNIAVKNPAVLLNNTIAGIMMQVTDNVPFALAMKNTKDAFMELKQLHYMKAQLFKMEQKGLAGSPEHMALRAELEGNVAYQAERSGVLKSFLDEGLWDRKIRANPEAPFDGSFIKNILLTEDSQAGVAVRKWHDYSDMMNRIAMYKYLKHQASPEELAKKHITNEMDIVRRIDQMFVNYSKLLPPMIAAMRRGGTVPFAQWFYRAPSFMIKQIRQHPVRALTIFATYEGLQALMDDKHEVRLNHDKFKDNYIGRVHTDSKYSQNALRPNNWLDSVNPIGLDPKTWIPAYMTKLHKGMPDAIGITTMPEYKEKSAK